MKQNRSEREKINEEVSGKKAFKLDEELLGQTFTPYKLRLIEQTTKLQNNATFLKNIFHKPGSSSKKGERTKSNEEMVKNLS